MLIAAATSRSHAQEEEEMQRALRESAQEAGITIQEQESGVIDTQGTALHTSSAPHFGPANRPDYEPESWAMVPLQSTERDVNSTPRPYLRKRSLDAPSFLVQGPNNQGGRLGSFLTILHAIPLARNKLLESGSPAAAYWHNSEWWNGKAIFAPDILTRIQAGELHPSAPEALPNFEEELHRLVAFLDGTDRSYGTVSALTDIVQADPTPDSAEKRFYEMFASRNPDQITPLYSKVTLGSVLDDDDDSEAATDEGIDMDEQTASFGLLETEVAKEDLKSVKTIYELLDHVMWSDVLQEGLNAGSRMAMYRQFGEVMTIKLDGDCISEENIIISETLYPERWLESRKPDARRIQKEWARTKAELQKLEEERSRLQDFRDPVDGQLKNKTEDFKKQRTKWEIYASFLENRARFRVLEESNFDINQYPDYKSSPCRMSDQEQKSHDDCKTMLNWIDDSIRALEEREKSRFAEMGASHILRNT